MEWLSNSEAMVWLKLQDYEREMVSTDTIRKTVKARALINKLHHMERKGWMVRVKKGRYYVPSFEEVREGKTKPYKIEAMDDVKDLEIPLALGSPANSEMFWYPMRKQQRIYALKKHLGLIDSSFPLKEMSREMFDRTITINGVRMLSLEDTIVESLQDRDVQSAMAMAHRQQEAIDWNYLIKRIKEENVEKLAYVALSRFPEAKVFRHNELPPLTESFIEKVLRENKVFAMCRGV